MEQPQEESRFVQSQEGEDLTNESRTNRRGFLGGLGAAGLAVLSSGLADPAKAIAATPKPSSQFNLSSLDNLKITRDETFDVPGGKEKFTDWEVSDRSKGIIKKFLTYHARVDGDGTYTMTTDIKIHTYELRAGVTESPLSSNEQHITVFAIKGEPSGVTREDKMIVTVIAADGTTTRQSLTVPVHLDTSQFDGMDTASLISKLGTMHLTGERP